MFLPLSYFAKKPQFAFSSVFCLKSFFAYPFLMRFSAANTVFNLCAIGFGLSAFSLQKPPYPRRFSPPFFALSFTKERTEPIFIDFA